MDEDYEIDFTDDLDIDDLLSNCVVRDESLFKLRYSIESLDSCDIGCWDE